MTLNDLCARLLPPDDHLLVETLLMEEPGISLVLSATAPKAIFPACMPLRPRPVWLWDGSPILPGLRRRVWRVSTHHRFWSPQIAEVEAQRRAQLQSSSDASIDKTRQLMLRQGIGINGAWLFMMAFVGWKSVSERR